MPKRKRTYSKKPSCHKRTRYVRKRRGPRTAMPFPLTKTVKMRYCTTVTLDPSQGGSASYLFRANSIFDPDATGIGHQPYGHDTYQTLYNSYRVTKSRIRVTGIPATTGSDKITIFGVAIKDDQTVETDFDTIRESSGSHWAYAIAQKNNSVSNGYNAHKMFKNLKPGGISASFGENPSEAAIFQVYVTGLTDAMVSPSSTQLVVTIDYTVQMYELKDLGQS